MVFFRLKFGECQRDVRSINLIRISNGENGQKEEGAAHRLKADYIFVCSVSDASVLLNSRLTMASNLTPRPCSLLGADLQLARQLNR